MDWLPTIAEWQGPIYLRIVDALSADIHGRRLHRGQQLPTHRALAEALGVDLTTVTRAYREARRRGLIEARVGQGTFVSETTARQAADIPVQVKIDLSMNVPPQPVEANLDLRIAQGFAAIRSEASFSAYLNYARPGGSDDEREIAARWLRPRLTTAAPERLVIYPGTQAALFNALLALTSPADVVLTENLTFPGIKAAASRLGVRLVGVEMDRDGVLPDALAAACRQHRPKAIYLIPTLHNPTTATLSPARRHAVADIVRQQGVWLIEDDAYGLLEPSVQPIANLVPERTYFAASMSKCIAPALRMSYLLAPDLAAEQVMRNNLQATMQMPPLLMVALLTHWIRTGVADQIIQAIRSEAIGRQQLAARLLHGLPFAARPAGHHLWLALPRQRHSAEFLSDVLRHGLAVVGSDAFAVGENAAQGVRVSLGAARNRAELAQALELLAGALRAPRSEIQIV
ncbi:MAG: PLP-dependent aminotransferase family protein [Xanthobacteraceae bacterium]|nr:PLP-dependent aminotransferase family protein [Xanthobacteraceae bacterium]